MNGWTWVLVTATFIFLVVLTNPERNRHHGDSMRRHPSRARKRIFMKENDHFDYAVIALMSIIGGIVLIAFLPLIVLMLL